MADYYVDINGNITTKKKKKKETQPSYVVDIDGNISAYKPDPDDIAPVVEQEENTWFQKGAFDDGYQFGDVTKSILGTGADVGENIVAGVLGMGEKAVDAIVGIGARNIEKTFGNAAPDLTGFIKKDLYDEEKIAHTIVNGLYDKVGFDVDANSVFGEKADSLVQSGGQLLGTAALQAVGVPWWITTGVTSFGGEVESALNEGASLKHANLSALVTAGAEILTEKISGGIKFGGKTLDDGLTKLLAKGISNRTVRTAAKLGIDTLGEGFEEVLSGTLSAIGQKLTYASDKEMSELFSAEEAWDSFVGGALLGFVGSGVQAGKAKKQGQDYVTGLTQNEEAVLNREIEKRIEEREKDGKKLTKKEKSALEDFVRTQLDKGYISTDTIEELFGGEEYKAFKAAMDGFGETDTYKAYQDTITEEKALLKEYGDLKKKIESGEYSNEELSRFNDLASKKNDLANSTRKSDLKAKLQQEAAKINAMQEKMHENVSKLVGRDSRLAESYNELARSRQKYTVDVSKYTNANARHTIQNIMDSGVADNTNEFHEFADWLARISADKGLVFSMTDTQKLKGTKHYFEGKVTNGFVDENGNITLNKDSAKSLNSTVGHEVTHVLEGTEFYKKLRSAVFDYAVKKEGLDSFNKRLKETEERYKGINNDPEAELLADLIGDYVFTDYEFVSNLAKSDRNAFQKIWDEIKYLYKVATAGSKEARELEKVKHYFEKAYNENIKSDGSTNYSLENGNKRKYNKRSRYSETETKFLIWENGSSPVGEVKKFVRFGKTHYYEKTENGCVELSRSQYNERNGAYAEDIDRRAERRLGTTVNYDESTQRGTPGYPDSYRDASGDVAVFGQAVRERLSNDTAGSVSGAPRYDSRADINQSEYDNEASGDPGASITFSNDYAAIRNYMKEGDTGETDVHYSLSPVEAVEPHSGLWHRTHTTDEAKAIFPDMWNVAAEDSEVRNPTQITSTVKSYRKVYDHLKEEGFNGTVLDASSGLGYGTKAGIEEYGFDVEDIEPYPDKGYNPKYRDYSALDKKYDVVISNAVLNVLPQDQRDALVVKMGELLNDGGRIFINVRGKDVESLAKTGKNIHLGDMEWIETVKGSYQKGFTKDELVAYLEDALGDGFTVKKTNMFGAVSAVVTKDGGVQYSLSDSDGNTLSKEQQEFFKDSKIKDADGNLLKVYHGTTNNFTTFRQSKADGWGTGIYFTDNKAEASEYGGNVVEAYLNIKNPYNADTMNYYDIGAENTRAYRDFDMSVWKNQFEEYDTYEEYKADGRGVDMYDIYAEHVEVFNKILRELGYDGIVADGSNGIDGLEIVAFRENQPKLTTNANPTTDSDIRYSLTDSEGGQLTNEQAEFFKDSKARDRNGNLLKVYHTTNNDFTVFDKGRKGETTGDYNTYLGFFFADTPEYMSQFPEFENGKTETYYLNMKNPIDMNNISKQAFLDIVEATGGDVQEAAELYDREYADELKRAKFRGDNSPIMEMSRLLEDLTGDYFDYAEFYNALKPNYESLMSKGYDGVINSLDGRGWANEYIVLDSNQAKLTSNKNPTADPDVRYSLTEYTEEEKIAHNKAVIDYFGKTYRWAETGYILLDGSKLDLSGKHEGAPGGYRTVDHRDIVDALGSDYGDDTYSGSLVQFMSEGNIRISPESDGINLSVKPNKAQEAALTSFIQNAHGEVMLDIDDGNGFTVVSVEYPSGTSAFKVLNDIRGWFDNGTEPQVSNLSQFRYSLTEQTEYAPTFFSQMARVVDDTRQQKLGAASVVNMLRGKGVKAEEIKWSGIEEWLNGKKSVTKEELQEFIKGSQLQIEETVLGDGDGTISYTEDEQHDLQIYTDTQSRRMDWARRLWREAYGEEMPLVIEGADDVSAAISREIIARNGGIRDFAGVDAMSEAEQTLYTEVCQGLHITDLWIAQIRERAEARQKNTSETHWGQYKLDGGENYREYLFKMPGSDYRNPAMDTHWRGERGVLAHARVQDFDTADGKMLFIEEIQSDWHNEGAKEGYDTKTAESVQAEQQRLFDRVQDDTLSSEERQQAYRELREFEREHQLHRTGKEVPDAPFSKTYQEYVLKRLIREAAEKGYDSIGWTTADIQSDRWSKDFAEGYRIEYDQDIPKFLNKYGKKWGANVEKTDIQTKHLSQDEEVNLYFYADLLEDGEDYIRNKKGVVEVWTMPITDAMKQSVLYEGQPQYSLSDAGKEQKVYGNYNYRMRHDPLAEFAPVAETATQPASNKTPIVNQEEERDLFPDDLAPIQGELSALLAEKDDLENRLQEAIAAQDMEAFNEISADYDAVMARIDELEQRTSNTDIDRLDGLTDADAPLEIAREYDSQADIVPLTKKNVTDIAREVKASLGLSSKQMYDVHKLIEEYSNSEFPSREQLFLDIKAKLGTYTEKFADETIKDARKYLRTTRLYVDDTIRREIADFADLRRRNRGRIRFTNSGTPVDMVYSELSDLYPHLFPESIINPTDQFLQIVDVANMDSTTKTEQEIDDDTLWRVADDIIEYVDDIKRNQREADANRYSREAFDSLMSNADEYAPPEDIAPVAAPVTTNAPAKESVKPTAKIAPTAENPTRVKELEALVGDKDTFIKQKALELYREIGSLKKGVRASESLGYLLDHGYEWRSIKTALLNIADYPGERVDARSAAESVAREMLNSEYEDLAYELSELQSGVGKSANTPITTVDERLAVKIASFQSELAKNQRLRDQSNADYDQEIARLQAEYNARQNKRTIGANDILRRIEKLRRMKRNVDADYSKRISDLEARIEKMNSPEYQTAEHRRSKMAEYTDMWEGLLGDTSTWKDMKLGLSYKTKTLRRILRKVVKDVNGNPDIGLADAIYDELETKYDHHEALLKRESQKLKEVYQKLNLNHAEDTYAHMLGEFRHNPQTTLTADVVNDYYNKNRSKIDVAKVEEAITQARKTFDDLLVRVNNVLREQGMKEIPYRQGYFPHFTNPKQNFLQKLFNWKPLDDEIPTSIAGLTEMFDPQRSWQSFNKQRTSDVTDYSLYQGLDTYIHGALDWIYHIEDIQKRRALENHIRYVHSEEGVKARIDAIKAESYDADEAQQMIDSVLAEAKNPLNNLVTDLRARTNTLANKKASMDRGMEEATNRKIYSTMTNLNNRINANMVVGSFSSALTNFIPMVQSWHQVSPLYTVRGLGDYIRSTIRDDGMIEKSDYLTNRLVEEENLYQTGWDKVSDKAAFMMNVVDSITSQTVWRSKYLQNIHEGMSEAEAIKDADQFAKNLMAGRSRGNQPTIFDAKNPLVKILTAFQLEVANQYGYMFDDVPQDTKSKARLVKGYATAFMGAYMYNALYSSLVGRNAAFDPISIFKDLLSDLGLFGDDEEEEPEDIILNLTDNILEEVPFVGGLIGGGRIPVSSAIPYGGDYATLFKDIANGEVSTKELLKPLYYLALPVGGGQLKKLNEGMSMFSDEHPVSGSYTDSGKLRFPVEDTLGNRILAGMFGQYASENARYYFDNDIAPLSEKQIQEYAEVDIPIRDYWDYRDGLKGKDTLGEKLAYIAGLDLPIDKKNLLANNIADRKEPIDLTDWYEYDGLEEFDYAKKYPEKYMFLEANGITVEQYNDFDEDTKEAYSWAYQNPDKFTLSKAVTGDIMEYRQYASDLNDIRADKDENGDSISGSAKEKKLAYINGLNIDYGQKVILYRSLYGGKEDRKTYNKDILDYLNSRDDISYEDKVTILRELDFTVLDDGTVLWD